MHHLLPNLKSSDCNLRIIGHGLCVKFIKFQLHKRHSLTEQYSITVINSLCIVFIVLCIICICIELVSIHSLLGCRVTRLS